jgi:hypothetical protein
VAAALFAPNVVWQAQHGWPSVEFTRHLRQETGAENLAQFVPLQLGIVTPAATVLWVAALRRLWPRRGPLADLRWMAVAYGALFAVLLVSQGKAYYLGSAYLPLVAVGATVVEARWPRRAVRRLGIAIVASGVPLAPIFTPLMPVTALEAVPLHHVDGDASAMLGWHEVAQQVAAVHATLPPDERATAKVLGASYSMAGAVDLWGPQLGLPRAISGHNSYYLWGYGADVPATTVAIGFDRSFLLTLFAACDDAHVLADPHDLMDVQVAGRHVWVCRGERARWAVLWPQLRSYG